MKDDAKTQEELDRILGKAIRVYSGVVTAVNEGDSSCSVQRTIDDADAVLEDVVLSVRLGNMSGLVLVPAEQADCLVAMVDDGAGYELLKASQYDKVLVTGDTLIQLNDGSLGGLVKVEALVTRLNKLEDDINRLKTVFASTWAPVPNDGGAALKAAAATWAAQQLTDTQRGDIENTKIKQG